MRIVLSCIIAGLVAAASLSVTASQPATPTLEHSLYDVGMKATRTPPAFDEVLPTRRPFPSVTPEFIRPVGHSLYSLAMKDRPIALPSNTPSPVSQTPTPKSLH